MAIRIVQVSQFASPSEKAEFKLRFAKEAAAAGRLSHPGIVTVHQLGEEGDLQYLVMELVDGSTLEKSLSDGQPCSRGMAISVLSQVADALDYAHGRGVVHGDVKPSNILVRPDGRAKIAGFGIAGDSYPAVATAGFSMETPAYMAPEQIAKSGADGKADQFSVAAIACQMLSGRRPFAAGSGPEADPLHESDRWFSPRTSEVLRKGLAKDPNQRFATCAEFVNSLSASLEEPMPAAPAAPGPVPVPRPVPVTAAQPPAWQAPARPVAPKPLFEAAAAGSNLVWVVAVLALIVVLGGGYMLYPGFHSTSGAPVSVARASDLGLRVEHSGTDLLLTWNHDFFSAGKGKTGKLQVVDGGMMQHYDLDRAQLSSGLGVVYSPQTHDVMFDMQVFDDRGVRIATGGVHVLHPEAKP